MGKYTKLNSIEMAVELEDRRDVAASIAIVGRAPYSDQILILEHVLEALLDELVCAADEFNAV